MTDQAPGMGLLGNFVQCSVAGCTNQMRTGSKTCATHERMAAGKHVIARIKYPPGVVSTKAPTECTCGWQGPADDFQFHLKDPIKGPASSLTAEAFMDVVEKPEKAAGEAASPKSKEAVEMVAKHGSISAAARALGISPAAVAHRLDRYAAATSTKTVRPRARTQIVRVPIAGALDASTKKSSWTPVDRQAEAQRVRDQKAAVAQRPKDPIDATRAPGQRTPPPTTHGESVKPGSDGPGGDELAQGAPVAAVPSSGSGAPTIPLAPPLDAPPRSLQVYEAWRELGTAAAAKKMGLTSSAVKKAVTRYHREHPDEPRPETARPPAEQVERAPTALQAEIWELVNRVGQAQAARDRGVSQGAIQSALRAYMAARGLTGRMPGYQPKPTAPDPVVADPSRSQAPLDPPAPDASEPVDRLDLARTAPGTEVEPAQTASAAKAIVSATADEIEPDRQPIGDVTEMILDEVRQEAWDEAMEVLDSLVDTVPRPRPIAGDTDPKLALLLEDFADLGSGWDDTQLDRWLMAWDATVRLVHGVSREATAAQ